MIVRDVFDYLEKICPARWAFDFDKVGFQLGDLNQAVTGCAVALDWSSAAIEHAEKMGAELLITHHPLFFNPIQGLTTGNEQGRASIRMIRAGISYIAAHTNWDCAPGGINDTLAELLGLQSIKPFGPGARVPYSLVTTYVPVANREAVLEAAHVAGAGVIGNYSGCGYWGEGTGTFLPEEGAQPAVGEVGVREEVSESRVEMLLPTSLMKKVENAIRAAHPYEEPVIFFTSIGEKVEQPIGRVGKVEPQTLASFAELVASNLGARCQTWGDPEKRVKSVAVVGGSASDEWIEAQRAGADVLVTGEVRHHHSVAAVGGGMPIIQAGHFATEQPGTRRLAALIANQFSGLKVEVFEPVIGKQGRYF